ncbi:hypothetical protein Pint_00255 [Pistacia integerrima]|uniref:Uncharacterized protein n=1 Tax=Pistacia integerrima TaxID=434235 RepID=A0ACC0ZHQ1_9ROSI|nr:hypothetical protein Pint_00255 [Pistacia integerrima]
MCLTDLEVDYINPYDSAARINMLVLPEFATQGILCIIYLITGHWFMFLLSLPYLHYNVGLYRRRQHLVDVTEIYSQLNGEKKQRLFKLCYLIILLVLCYFGQLENLMISQTAGLRSSLPSLNPGGWVKLFYVIILVEKAVSVAATEMMILGEDLQLKEQ